jgi:hypothetical protein
MMQDSRRPLLLSCTERVIAMPEDVAATPVRFTEVDELSRSSRGGRALLVTCRTMMSDKKKTATTTNDVMRGCPVAKQQPELLMDSHLP